MTFYWCALYLSLGAFTGFFAGLLGIGGGLILTPVLAMFFAAQGFPAGEIMHLALGSSMSVILFTALSSMREHARHRAVLWPVFARITPGILLGTLFGTWLARQIPTESLAIVFAFFTLYVALQIMIGFKPRPSRTLPGAAGVMGAGFGVGMISCLVAIGGGALSVPFMTWCNVKIQNAIATSAAIGLPIALGGAAGYMLNGWGNPALPPHSLGFVYLPAVLLAAFASMLTARFGARLTHRLPIARLKQIFAALLILLSGKMLWTLF
ncbi:MAG: sulfite exporter TauE/SafE family protein [Zoogloeaceae bacterium]|jgi:uncharacterized membrane protein YfcA|nr:sulfite exporter TauE/SafE family protein [Zoogloeaceae bacterium]